MFDPLPRGWSGEIATGKNVQPPRGRATVGAKAMYPDTHVNIKLDATSVKKNNYQ